MDVQECFPFAMKTDSAAQEYPKHTVQRKQKLLLQQNLKKMSTAPNKHHTFCLLSTCQGPQPEKRRKKLKSQISNSTSMTLHEALRDRSVPRMANAIISSTARPCVIDGWRWSRPLVWQLHDCTSLVYTLNTSNLLTLCDAVTNRLPEDLSLQKIKNHAQEDIRSTIL